MTGMGSHPSLGQDPAPQCAEPSSPAPRFAASDVRATVLALQRTAGNRAVAGLLGRRMLQRSSTYRDVEQQKIDDLESVRYRLETGGTRLVDAVEPDPGETSQEMELVMPEEPVDAPQMTGTTTAAPVTSPFSFTSPFVFPSDSPFTFTFTASPSYSFGLSGPSASTPAPQPPQGMKRAGGRLDDTQPRKRFAGGFFRPVPLPQPILATWPARGRRLQRKNPQVGTFAKAGPAGGAFTWRGPKPGSATKTRVSYVPSPGLTSNATTLATGLHTHADITGSSGATRGTAREMKVKRWIVVKGTGTAQNVRPAGWDRFQALCGFIDKSHKCTYVQGHLLYERLGGRGNRMANLAPFTTSLNKRHQNQVEKPLWSWLKAAPKGEERTIDYHVVPTYGGGGPPTVITDAQGYFQRFVDGRNADALKTLVKLVLLDATDVATVQGQQRSAAVVLGAPKTAHTTWAALCSALEQEIADYIAAAFPTQIDCYARLYKRTSSTADWDKTVQQHHTLPNYR
jgi:hypothetical protein